MNTAPPPATDAATQEVPRWCLHLLRLGELLVALRDRGKPDEARVPAARGLRRAVRLRLASARGQSSAAHGGAGPQMSSLEMRRHLRVRYTAPGTGSSIEVVSTAG